MPNRRSSPSAASVARRSTATARKAHETFEAAASVIAARTGAKAMASYTSDGGAEIGLMVSEKVAAFSEAGAAVAAGAADIAGHGAAYAGKEAEAAHQAMAKLAACRTPVQLMSLQGQLMADFLGRSLNYGLGVNALIARTGEDALHPIHRTVTANDRRLKK